MVRIRRLTGKMNRIGIASTLAATLAMAQTPSEAPSFEAASIRRNRTMSNSQSGDAQAQQDPLAPPGFVTAVEDQLGLKLVKQKMPVQLFVIDHVERPSEN